MNKQFRGHLAVIPSNVSMGSFTRRLGVALVTLGGMVGSAMAELPTGVGTAITAATTDGTTAVGLLAAFGAAVFLIYKVLKRLGII